MISLADLPKLNAILNSIAAAFLIFGYVCIRKKHITAHRSCMGVAFVASVLFLISYLTYHFKVGHIPFMKEGFIRSVYFFILTTHMVLAVSVIPLAVVTFYRGYRNDLVRHKKIAKWTLPIWLYVSITGVMVYFFLY